MTLSPIIVMDFLVQTLKLMVSDSRLATQWIDPTRIGYVQDNQWNLTLYDDRPADGILTRDVTARFDKPRNCATVWNMLVLRELLRGYLEQSKSKAGSIGHLERYNESIGIFALEMLQLAIPSYYVDLSYYENTSYDENTSYYKLPAYYEELRKLDLKMRDIQQALISRAPQREAVILITRVENITNALFTSSPVEMP